MSPFRDGALDTNSFDAASRPHEAILDAQGRRAYAKACGRAASELKVELDADLGPPLGFAIVGMGRAGKIHLECLREAGGEEARVCWLVDTDAAVLAPYAQEARVTTDVAEALRDEEVSCVIVATTTPHHAPLIRVALAAGKHVFAEKPLCCKPGEAGALFALAEAQGKLLHTAYNRRSDPAIQAARDEVRSGAKGRPLGATLVSRDYPYPLPAYLAVSGNIFKDCVVHDLDYLTWLLDDPCISLRAHASSGEGAAAVARACGMWEYSEVHLVLRSGATATLINGRVSSSYEHRLDVYCEEGVVRVANPHEGEEGVAFSTRFAASYRAQLAEFRKAVRAVLAGGSAAANLSLRRTLHLEELVLACEASVAGGGISVPISPEEIATSPAEIGAISRDEIAPKAAGEGRGEEERLGEKERLGEEERRGESHSPRSIEGEPLEGKLADESLREKLADELLGGCDRAEAYPVREAGRGVARQGKAEAVAEAARLGEAEVGAEAQVRAEGARGEHVAAKVFRSYEDTLPRVKEAYRKMRALQSVEHVRMCRDKYCAPGALGGVRMSMWAALATLDGFVDLSDPDTSLPNSVHAFQTAEGLRAARMPDWLQLTGLLHDLGKMIYLRGCDEDGTSMAEQWSIVGDTWVVGCEMPSGMILPELNASSPDARHPERTTPTGIYQAGCGLDNTLCAFGHDEYMYQVLVQSAGVTLPKEALSVVRYHSLYPWHELGCYAELENDYDRCVKGWVKLFNQHDLYTKRDTRYTEAELAEMRAYYGAIADKYLPAQLDF